MRDDLGSLGTALHQAHEDNFLGRIEYVRRIKGPRLRTAQMVLRASQVHSCIRKCGSGFRTDYQPICGEQPRIYCGRFLCPWCSGLPGTRIANRINDIVEAATQKGLTLALVTLTARDQDDLRGHREALTKAYASLWDHRAAKRFYKRGLVGAARVWE